MVILFLFIGVAALCIGFGYFRRLLSLDTEPQKEKSDNVVYFDFGKNSLLSECLMVLEQSRVVDIKIAKGEQVILESIELSRNRDRLLEKASKKSA